MGRAVQLGQEYFDNSPFCVGYRDGTIQTLVPAPECWDLVAAPAEATYGPALPAPVEQLGYRVRTGVAERDLFWLLAAAALGLVAIAKR